MKKKLEYHFRKLQDLIDHLDKIHKDCTITNMLCRSVSMASGVRGLLGLALAPSTTETSLVLSATSMDLGVTEPKTSLVTTIVEKSSRLSDESEANIMVGVRLNVLDILTIMPKMTVKLCSTVLNLVNACNILMDQFQAIKTYR